MRTMTEEHGSSVEKQLVSSVELLCIDEKDEQSSSSSAAHQEQQQKECTTALLTTNKKQLSKLQFVERTTATRRHVLICDAGYGFPTEARPRREKILAVAKQLYNFLQWQQQEAASSNEQKEECLVRIMCRSEKDKVQLQSRLKQLWKRQTTREDLPDHVEFCHNDNPNDEDTLLLLDDDDDAVYLSPDSTNVLSPSDVPPSAVIVGMLIDRRIQPNRSLHRANKMKHTTTSARLPLESLSNKKIHPQEPLNVDVVLEGMQQWWWNVDHYLDSTGKKKDEIIAMTSLFVQAANQALERHYQRHPNRPHHKK